MTSELSFQSVGWSILWSNNDQYYASEVRARRSGGKIVLAIQYVEETGKKGSYGFAEFICSDHILIMI